MKKSKLLLCLFLMAYSCFASAMQPMNSYKPFIIINSTTSELRVKVLLSDGSEKLKTIASRAKWSCDVNEHAVVDAIEWKEYYMPFNILVGVHKIIIADTMPTMVRGGSLVISKDGSYMYDDKNGLVKFGVTQ